METIIFGSVIVALAIVAIWFYNRQSNGADINRDGRVDINDASEALSRTVQGIVQDTRDIRDSVLTEAAESAARAATILDQAAKKPAAKARSVAKSTKAVADKKPAVRAKTASTRKPRAKKSS